MSDDDDKIMGDASDHYEADIKLAAFKHHKGHAIMIAAGMLMGAFQGLRSIGVRKEVMLDLLESTRIDIARK